MPKELVIVESPAKAKTIGRYLGPRYSVKSSFGHIRDLPKRHIGVDPSDNFKPQYVISPDKKKVVGELKRAAAGADRIWLASDEDREGEAIAWHLAEALKLPSTRAKRIVFHEITKPAIEAAIKQPRPINLGLVNAQQARRILDRLVGYELSPLLWKKVRPGLSAGRVQSVAVRLIVERERAIRTHQQQSDFRLSAVFKTGGGHILTAELNRRLPEQTAARSWLRAAAGSQFTVMDRREEPAHRKAPPPFTTSTLQQTAASRLGYSVKRTMMLAQRLYEEGLITYMRTDSLSLSTLALSAAERYIIDNYGQRYHRRRQYRTRQAGAQEAHEAIRPTDLSRANGGQDPAAGKLYELIWQRTLASQMTDAVTLKTEVVIAASNAIEKSDRLVARGQVLQFDGFYKVYGSTREDAILPEVATGEQLKLVDMEARETPLKPPARYSEARLVRKLEELGIGRPSTYAPTVSTIQSRGYVERADVAGQPRQLLRLILADGQVREEQQTVEVGAERKRLLPTPLAEQTTDFLVKHFGPILDYDFTARAETDLDAIAGGQQDWPSMLKRFYDQFHPMVNQAESVSRQESSQARSLGNDPASGRPIVARYGRYGPMLQRGETESSDKPDFAPLPPGRRIENVTLEDALTMFKLPRQLGKTADDQAIIAAIGRFGPYIKVGSDFVAMPQDDPFTVTKKRALELYKNRQQAAQKRLLADLGQGVSIINGRYGPYVTDGQKNVRLPAGSAAADVTLAQAKEWLSGAPARSSRRATRLTGRRTRKPT